MILVTHLPFGMHLIDRTRDDPRRDFLIKALMLTSGIGGLQVPAWAQSVFGARPAQLPAGQSIYSIDGQVTVNAAPATLTTPIAPGDTVKTGDNSQVIFVVGGNSMILRANSEITVGGGKKEDGAFFVSALRMLTGKVLSVSQAQPMQVQSATATIGIRGTGFYLESDPELSYFCTCYGVTDVASNVDPNQRETVTASHHDRPLVITNQGGAGDAIRTAGFRSHTDQELMLIETLVGRNVPFVFPGGSGRSGGRGY